MVCMYNNIILTESISENIGVFDNFRAVCGRTNNQLLDISLYHYIGLVSGWQDQTLGYVQLPNNYYRHVMQIVLLQFHLFVFYHNTCTTLSFLFLTFSLATIPFLDTYKKEVITIYIVVSTRFCSSFWIQAQIYVIIQDLWN